ncbi:MAG: NAD-dependent DNA ligase LigA [Candidatus Spechtbacterales bacterium]|nr:NAD-dependent DNA ligase LigA [Candidatus Spechtbacterales bacterium]
MPENLNKTQAKKRIEKLKKVIKHHRYLYHVLDSPEISDAALDSLKYELKELEDEYPDLVTSDSPTQRVGGEALDKFEKAEHSKPMLSIEDIFDREELDSWESYIKKLAEQDFSYFCEVKVDGLALALRYEEGVLSKAITRGNGRIGEDVTSNAKTIESIPLGLKFHEDIKDSSLQKNIENIINSGIFEIRGEVYIAKEDFEQFNSEKEKKGEDTYANPRNLAAGSVRQLDPKLAASRPLNFIAYDIVTDIDTELHSIEHDIMHALGFKTDPTAKKCKNTDQVYKYWQNISDKRDKLPYQIDGVVISVDQNKIFDNLGVAGKSPRGIRAFKFAAKQATTVVEDIRVHVGRTGAVTPLAVLRPVQIGGVTVSRATLHNFEEVERLDVRVGDTIILERAGDVIPKVVEVVGDLRPNNAKKIKPPKKCPKCNTLLEKKEGEAILYCPNPECESRKEEHLYYFVSRPAFDIEGLGPKIIDKLLEEELITGPEDIFTLKKGDLVPLERFAERSAQNIIDSIENSKEIPFARFIAALNIRHVGGETAIDLARHFKNIKNLQNSSLEELKSIDGIGEKVAKSIYDWFGQKENKEFIEKLLKAGVKIVPPEGVGNKLDGLTFVFTGSLNNFTREEAENKVRALGGNPSGSISKNTDYLVAGEGGGSKYNKAKKLGVKIVNEQEFLKLVK